MRNRSPWARSSLLTPKQGGSDDGLETPGHLDLICSQMKSFRIKLRLSLALEAPYKESIILLAKPE